MYTPNSITYSYLSLLIDQNVIIKLTVMFFYYIKKHNIYNHSTAIQSDNEGKRFTLN